MSELNIHISPDQPELITVSGWTLNAKFGVLNNPAGQEHRLEPRLAKLLFMLFSQPESFVSRDALISAVWPDVIVTEQSLTRAVADLRKSLNSGYDHPPTIETASKMGYRLTFTAPDSDVTEDNSRIFKIGRFIIVFIGIFILLMLVIRGINY